MSDAVSLTMGNSALPLRDGRLRHADVVGEHLLCEPLRLPQTGDIFRKVQKFHRVFPHFCSHYTRPRRPAQATRATLGEKKSTAAIHRVLTLFFTKGFRSALRLGWHSQTAALAPRKVYFVTYTPPQNTIRTYSRRCGTANSLRL